MPKLHQSEGDINISPRRDAWQKEHLDAEAAPCWRRMPNISSGSPSPPRASTPCAPAAGIWIEDLQGRRYMDFHGNNVHQVGFANPAVIAAIKDQLDDLSFCTRRYTNRVAVDLAKKLAEIAPDPLKKSSSAPAGRRRSAWR